MKFNIREINMGRVQRTGTVEAVGFIEAYNEAHPELMDPLIQCARGGKVTWMEITPINKAS